MENEGLLKKFNNGRIALLTVVVLTLLNVILTLTEADLHFLFSANMPIFFASYGFYGGGSFYIILALFIIGLYGLCWVLSKKVRVWMLAALILFTIDVLFFIWLLIEFGFELDFSVMIEVAFCVWIMISFVSGVMAWSKLRNTPESVMETDTQETVQADPEDD